MRWSPLSAIDHTMNKLVALTEGLPVGTNLALLHFLWMLVSGALLAQRVPSSRFLQSIGLSDRLPGEPGQPSEVVCGKQLFCCACGRNRLKGCRAGEFTGMKAIAP